MAGLRAAPCSSYRFPDRSDEQRPPLRRDPGLQLGLGSRSPRTHRPNQPDFQLGDLIAGTYDAYIREFAEEARDWGHPFFLRFNWEMNGDWFPWCEGVHGNAPGEYVAAWRHVHDIFTAVGATNATWVWCPYADTEKRLRADLRSLYPGDAYVDWTCLDGYNWGQNPVNPRPWRSFTEIFDPPTN